MDSTAAADFSLSISGAAQQASHPQAAVAGAFSPPHQPPLAELVSDSSSQVPVVPLPLMGTHTTAIVPLANTHQVVSLKLTNTNYLYWRMQMKPYLLGQGVFHFVDGSMPCPQSYIFDSSAGSSSTISPSFLRWKQHDQHILSALLSSLSVDVLHLVVDCFTSHCVWCTLEKAFASPSNSRIMQPFKTFCKVTHRLVYTCSKPNRYLMNWLLLVAPCLLKISISMCFVAFVASSKTW
jgi:hypothetical protein